MTDEAEAEATEQTPNDVGSPADDAGEAAPPPEPELPPLDTLSKDALDVTRAVLKARWNVRELDAHTLQFNYITAEGVPHVCMAWVNPDLALLCFRIIATTPVEPDQQVAVMDYITQVNYALPMGCLALDVDSGELRFKGGLLYHEVGLVKAQVEALVRLGLSVIDAHAEPLIRMVLGFNPYQDEGDKAGSALDAFVMTSVRAWFVRAGLADVTEDEVTGFLRHLDVVLGKRWEAFQGLSAAQRKPETLAAMHADGTLQLNPTNQVWGMVRERAKRLQSRRPSQADG